MCSKFVEMVSILHLGFCVFETPCSRAHLTDSSRSRVADTEPLGGLTTEVRTTWCSSVQHHISNDDVVLRLETAWKTFRWVNNQLTTTETLKHTHTQTDTHTHTHRCTQMHRVDYGKTSEEEVWLSFMKQACYTSANHFHQSRSPWNKDISKPDGCIV